MNIFQEFKPAFTFLAKFLAIYILGNVVYGIFVESSGNRPDEITSIVTRQASAILSWFGEPVSVINNMEKPTVLLQQSGNTILSVYEGCNGVNVMVVFIAFILAFGGKKKMIALFIITGLVIIHAMNLIRILLLYYVALSYQHYFYFVHKYIFTAVLYLVVFALWTIWIMYFNERTTHSKV